MSSTEVCLCYITCPENETALKLAKLAVEAKLAACANILPGMTSVYFWEGKLETSSEVVLILKTKTCHSDSLENLILSHHPYECPCFITLPVTGISEKYLQWICSSV